jgi:outer membrane protein TolC
MKKRLITIMLSLALVSSFTYRDVNAEISKDKMNYVNVIKYTIGENVELNIYRDKIKLAKERYENVLSEIDEDTDTSIEDARRESLYPIKSKLELEDIKWEMEQKQQQIYSVATKNYYNILIQDELIEMQKNQIEIIEKQIEQKKKEIEIGTAAKISLMDYELSLDQAQVELKKLNDEKEKIIMDLNINMARDVEQNLIIQEKEIPYEEYKIDDLDKIIKKLTETYYTITRIEEEITVTVQDKNIMILHNTSEQYDDAIENAKDKLVELDYAAKDKKSEVEYKVRSDYNNLLKLHNEVLIKQLDYENKMKLLKTADTRQELGYITELEYRNFEKDASTALEQYEKAKLDYYIAIENFKFFVK